MNSNVILWIHASIVKHFKALDVQVQLESEDVSQYDVNEAIAELRISGPHINEVSKNEFSLGYQISMLVKLVASDTDLYKTQRQQANILSKFVDIVCYKYGDGDTCFETLQRRGKIAVETFNPYPPGSGLLSGTVTAEYELTYKEN